MNATFDYSQIIPYFYPVFVVAGLFVYGFFRGIVMVFLHLLKVETKNNAEPVETKKASRFFSRKRAARPDDDDGDSADGPRPLMSEEKLQIYRMAKVQFKQNKIVEAAQMLETIDLGDKAVRILIKHGKIEDAARTLVRMNQLQHAAELLDEHKFPAQAAELYVQLENWAKAAQCTEEGASGNYLQYFPASEYYLKAGNLDKAVALRSKLGLMDDIFDICVNHKAWILLAQSMEFPGYAFRMLPRFDAKTLEDYLLGLENVPHTSMVLAHWITWRSDDAMVLTILQKLGQNLELAILFWQSLDAYGLETMGQRSLAVKRQLQPGPLKIHAEALLAIGRAEWAHDMLNADARPPLPVPTVIMKI